MIQPTTRTIFLAAALLFSSASQATLWNVTGVLDGLDGSFGFSSLHNASGNSPMSGPTFGDITTASGTYNDITGALSLALGFDEPLAAADDTFSLTGTLLFSGGDLAADSQLNITGLDLAELTNGNFGFKTALNCCGGTNGPNSFTAEAGGVQWMTLWGADFSGGTFMGSYDDSSVGIDLRITLSSGSDPISAVPVPAAVWLFGTALIGLVGFSKRKKAV